jgi:Signal peptidase, peptidase S26
VGALHDWDGLTGGLSQIATNVTEYSCIATNSMRPSSVVLAVLDELDFSVWPPQPGPPEPTEAIAATAATERPKRRRPRRGKTLMEFYLSIGSSPSQVPFAVTLRAGQMWVMGDNRAVAIDSRIWGPLPMTDIPGPRHQRVRARRPDRGQDAGDLHRGRARAGRSSSPAPTGAAWRAVVAWGR